MKKNQHTHNSNTESSEPHYGDMRKGAYLKRRAAYRTQAKDNTPARAGRLTSRGKGGA